MTKWVEYYIARRLSNRENSGDGSHHNRAPEGSLMSRVATLAVSLSVAVMILTIAVILGFKGEVRSRLTQLSGEVVVSSQGGKSPILRSPILEELIQSSGDGLKVTPFISRAAVINSPEGIEGVILKGLDSLFDTSILSQGLIEGEVPHFGSEGVGRGAVVCSTLARELKLKLNSRLELLIFDEATGEIERELYRISAIYTNGLGEMERGFVMVDMRTLQRLNQWEGNQISGYEISMPKGDNSLEVAQAINTEILYSESEQVAGVVAYATEELYSSIFDWLAALDLNGVVVISIMTIVAIFNIITAILILVLERMQMVGVLKSLGMTNSSLSRLFLLRALSITLWGLLWGNIVGLSLAMVQRWWSPIKLDEAAYILDAVPIELGVGWLVVLNVGVVVTILVSLLLPTRLVSRIEPHKAIKFQ